MPRLNLIGQKFGRLYVKDFAYIKNKRTFWLCVCDCNPEKETIIMGKYLTNGDTRSCGCLNLEKAQQMGLNNKEYNDYYIIDDIVHIKFFNCDDEFLCNISDWERAKTICWYKNNTGYARGKVNNKFVLFHDYIMNVNPCENIQVDHINGNRLDNTRKNLRICDRQHNAYNHSIRTNNTSGVTGVSWHKLIEKWVAYINVENKRIELGAFDNFQDAVNARLDAEQKYFKEYSRNQSAERIS